MMVTHSRIAVTGLRYDAPCHRSTMIGLDTPRPAIARPPDSSLIVRKPIAIAPGVRICIGMTPVASSALRVLTASAARLTNASGPLTSAIHNEGVAEILGLADERRRAASGVGTDADVRLKSELLI